MKGYGSNDFKLAFNGSEEMKPRNEIMNENHSFFFWEEEIFKCVFYFLIVAIIFPMMEEHYIKLNSTMKNSHF